MNKTNTSFILFCLFSYFGGFNAHSSLSCVDRAEPMYHFFDEGLTGHCSQNNNFLSLPRERSVLDLTHINESSSEGTCGEYLKPDDQRNYIELDLYDLYIKEKFPILVKLPIVKKQSQACKEVCYLGEQQNPGTYQKTFFGISFHLKETPFQGRVPRGMVLAFRAQSPWFFVTGNEVEPVSCMDARPTINEFGKPLACGSIYYGNGFGFATPEETTEVGYVIMDLIPKESLGDFSWCCPYRCD